LRSKEAELKSLEAKTVRQMWEDDLQKLVDNHDFGVAKESRGSKGSTSASKINGSSETQKTKASHQLSKTASKPSPAKSQP